MSLNNVSTVGGQDHSPTGALLLTDSYPDSFGEQNLDVFDLHNKQLTSLGSYAPGLRYVSEELRCDLHPRWSGQGDHIIIDSSHNGGRAIYMFDVRHLLGES